MRLTPSAILTTTFGICIAVAAISVSPAAPGHMIKHASLDTAQIAHGKALIASKGCDSCHSSNLAGKKGFSPSIRATGITRKYNTVTWARMMNTGVTEDGGHVKAPMPVYHMAAKDSLALYAYLKTQH